MTSSPLARKSSWKPALVWRNDGDGLSITIGVSDVSSMVIYPLVGWGFHLKPSFQCKRESCPERNARPAHSDRWSLVEEGSTPVWVAAVWGGGIGGMWRVGCLPPYYHHHPGHWNGQVWWCVMRHTWHELSLITAAIICRALLSSGDQSLSRECTLESAWVQKGSVEGSSAAEVTSCQTHDPDKHRAHETAEGPGCRAV